MPSWEKRRFFAYNLDPAIAMKFEIEGILEELRKKFVRGSPCMKRKDPEVLFEFVSRGKTYVEIGTMWGGSALVAGLAGCEVHCIDPWQMDASPDDVMENWVSAGFDPDKLFLYKQYHPPWPEAIKDRKFDIGLIDGEHTEKQCRLDWEEMKSHISGYILFHDIDSYPGIEKVFREGAADDGWEIAGMGLGIGHQYGILRNLS